MADFRYPAPTGNAQLDSFLRAHIEKLNIALSASERKLDESTRELSTRMSEIEQIPKSVREAVAQHGNQIADIQTELENVESRLAGIYSILADVQLDIKSIYNRLNAL